MSGGPRYSFKTRVGNWQEEQRLEEAKFDSFRAAKSRNELGGGGRRIKLNKCLQPVPLSYSPDSTIRFGDTILLESCETGGALACDPFEEVRYFSITVRYFPLLAKAPAVNVTLQI
eukprot:2389-Heterococcus_DN1.PRE.1